MPRWPMWHWRRSRRRWSGRRLRRRLRWGQGRKDRLCRGCCRRCRWLPRPRLSLRWLPRSWAQRCRAGLLTTCHAAHTLALPGRQVVPLLPGTGGPSVFCGALCRRCGAPRCLRRRAGARAPRRRGVSLFAFLPRGTRSPAPRRERPGTLRAPPAAIASAAGRRLVALLVSSSAAAAALPSKYRR